VERTATEGVQKSITDLDDLKHRITIESANLDHAVIAAAARRKIIKSIIVLTILRYL